MKSSVRWTKVATVGVVLVLGALVAACSGNESADVELSAAAQAGYDIARDNACLACHSISEGDGVAPTWKGLYGSEVKLKDVDELVVADEDYLRRAIVDPGAEVREGFSVKMPSRPMDDAEVDAIIDLLRELGKDS